MSSESRRPILNRLFAVASALSLLLCLMTVAARVVLPRLSRNPFMGQKINTLSDQTRVVCNYGLTGYGLSCDRSRELLSGMVASRKVIPNLDGFGFRLYSGSAASIGYVMRSGHVVVFSQRFVGLSLLIPYWAIALLALVLPMAYSPRLLRRLRQPRCTTLCAACGYDLRATPNRCPECGKIPVDRGVGRPEEAKDSRQFVLKS